MTRVIAVLIFVGFLSAIGNSTVFTVGDILKDRNDRIEQILSR